MKYARLARHYATHVALGSDTRHLFEGRLARPMVGYRELAAADAEVQV
jgi:hypothetical protein